MEPQIFKADPEAIEESQRFKVLGWLALPGKGGPALKKDIDNAVIMGVAFSPSHYDNAVIKAERHSYPGR